MEYINFDSVKHVFCLLSIIYILILTVIFMDLWAGVRKAKARNEYRSSYGLRKTVEKVGKYFNMIFVITIIDIVQMIAISGINAQTGRGIVVFPLFTVLGAIFVSFIELKSIYEKNEDKDKARVNELMKTIEKIAKDKDKMDAMGSLMHYIQNGGAKNEKEGDMHA